MLSQSGGHWSESSSGPNQIVAAFSRDGKLSSMYWTDGMPLFKSTQTISRIWGVEINFFPINEFPPSPLLTGAADISPLLRARCFALTRCFQPLANTLLQNRHMAQVSNWNQSRNSEVNLATRQVVCRCACALRYPSHGVCACASWCWWWTGDNVSVFLLFAT